jgi:hypothetical protein
MLDILGTSTGKGSHLCKLQRFVITRELAEKLPLGPPLIQVSSGRRIGGDQRRHTGPGLVPRIMAGMEDLVEAASPISAPIRW